MRQSLDGCGIIDRVGAGDLERVNRAVLALQLIRAEVQRARGHADIVGRQAGIAENVNEARLHRAAM
jgi:hypothetical protein